MRKKEKKMLWKPPFIFFLPVIEMLVIGYITGNFFSLNNILNIMMIITVNLGVVNLLPLPALDGGRLIFLIIEAIRRKPMNPKYEGWVHAAGFVFLMCFMVVITFGDISRLFGWS